MTFGILYVASGSKYLKEAVNSAQLSSIYLEGIPLSLCTDINDPSIDLSIFDRVLPLSSPEHSYRDKIVGLLDLPYETTLFLDTDAKLVHSVSNLFSDLSRFDVAGTFAPVRVPPGWVDLRIPSFFPEINTGVLLLKRNSIVHQLLIDWIQLYDYLFKNLNQTWDQASFRSVLWKYIHDLHLSFFNLPAEYNIRTTKPWIVGRGMHAKIIHGRYPQKEHKIFVEYLNSDIDKFRTSDIWTAKFPGSVIRPRFDRTYK